MTPQLIALLAGLLAQAPQAITSAQALIAMNKAGIDPNPEQWTKLVAGLDAANSAVQVAAQAALHPNPPALPQGLAPATGA